MSTDTEALGGGPPICQRSAASRCARTTAAQLTSRRLDGQGPASYCLCSSRWTDACRRRTGGTTYRVTGWDRRLVTRTLIICLLHVC